MRGMKVRPALELFTLRQTRREILAKNFNAIFVRADNVLKTFARTCPRGQFLTGHLTARICLPVLK